MLTGRRGGGEGGGTEGERGGAGGGVSIHMMMMQTAASSFVRLGNVGRRLKLHPLPWYGGTPKQKRLRLDFIKTYRRGCRCPPLSLCRRRREPCCAAIGVLAPLRYVGGQAPCLRISDPGHHHLVSIVGDSGPSYVKADLLVCTEHGVGHLELGIE